MSGDNEQFWAELVETRDGSVTLRHPDLDECYHTHQGALFEARNLYAQKSGFAEAVGRGGEDLAVLDVGLGLGYNALATIEAWRAAETPANVTVVSLENDPRLAIALAKGIAPWLEKAAGDPFWKPVQALSGDSSPWAARIFHPTASNAELHWHVHITDAHEWVRHADAEFFDYIWQDPFSPEKNPPLWSEGWFRDLRRAVADGAVLVTYSVARLVRDNLTSAGWTVEKIPAAGSAKKHWLRAH